MTYPYCEICKRPIKDDWWLVSRFQNKRHVSCDLAFRKRTAAHDVVRDAKFLGPPHAEPLQEAIVGVLEHIRDGGQDAYWIQRRLVAALSEAARIAASVGSATDADLIKWGAENLVASMALFRDPRYGTELVDTEYAEVARLVLQGAGVLTEGDDRA